MAIRTTVLTLIGVFAGAACIGTQGCTSAETGASNRAGEPQQEMVSPTVDPGVQTAAVESRRDSVPKAPRKPKTPPRVRSSQDTVRAATARRNRPAQQTERIVRPPNALYTVQVGAFRKASNALRMQRLVKKQVAGLPVYNNFHPSDKLYRVTVGKFAKRSEASSLRRRLIASDSTAYGQCWVAYTKR
jgi:cell division septation protein DedD